MQLFLVSSNKLSVHYLPSPKQQKDKVSKFLLNIARHLAAQEPNISLPEIVGDQSRVKESEYYLITGGNCLLTL